MTDTAIRRSPIDGRRPTSNIETVRVCDMLVPRRFSTPQFEQTALEDLNVCDLSFLTKWGIKGAGAENWLTAAGLSVPQENFATAALSDDGLIVRLPGNEFLLESGVANEVVPTLIDREVSASDVFPVVRQDATLLLSGARSSEVLAQTCGLDIEKLPQDQAVMTRVAGVSCTMLPQQVQGVQAFRIWVDCSYAVYLWDTLVEIGTELGGHMIGPATLLADLE